jgi:transcriptional regulator with XRE-family HTH domain
MRRSNRIGPSQQELSDVLRIDQSNLIAFEAGEELINAALLVRIAKVLEIPIDYFFHGHSEYWQTI